MHDEATLVKGTGKIAADGAVVTITDVEKVYSSSAAVKGKEHFRCADDRCKVDVIAVIPEKFKAGRQTSPSSYFRANPKPHIAGCSRRKSQDATDSKKLSGSKPAHTKKADFPTRGQLTDN